MPYGCPGVKEKVVRLASLACFAPLILLGGAGCAQIALSTQEVSKQQPSRPAHVEIERCADRTETPGRDLGLEATKAFEEKLSATTDFVVGKDARYRLACEVSGFVEGSAMKRWLWPGWGATVGRVSAMLTETKTEEIVVIAEGSATVSAGGLYTIGAENYIVGIAVESVVEQLSAWARGKSVGTSEHRGETVERGNRQ